MGEGFQQTEKEDKPEKEEMEMGIPQLFQGASSHTQRERREEGGYEAWEPITLTCIEDN